MNSVYMYIHRRRKLSVVGGGGAEGWRGAKGWMGAEA